jgi:hypothetical protein
MQWGVTVLAVVGVVGGIAVADPIGEERLLEHIWKGDAKQRASSAKALAERIDGGHAHAIELGRSAVISNDPKVRVPLLDALIGQNVIERASAAFVPTASVLERRIRQLMPKEKPDELPTARNCSVLAGTPRAVTLHCSTSQCAGACMHVTRTLEVTTGVRWKIEVVQSNRMDDGSCGDCML